MPEIRKVKVSTGIEWVEVPAAGVYILCGCPPDSVKHLMKLGLIVPTERDGWTFETGPNAILLSDVILQNGSFTNMAEFPVLQMLYRQGTLIPNHPNNTGIKPILIGAEDQINAQMEYIHRGNYGLVSEEEMVKGGASPEEAKTMMRMKLRFAFGAIHHPSALLDHRVLKEDAVEIQNGVYVKRLALNKFEISYGTESIQVNLKLEAQEHYVPSYPLGYHRVARDSFSIIHSGDGDGWDVNRPTMSSVVFYQGKIYLVDAGPNVRVTLQSLGIGISEVDGIFHTHSHDDHFAGLPAFIRSDRKINYYAAPYVRASVAKKLSALLSIEEDRFSDFFNIHDLEVDEWNDVHGLEVRPRLSPHPVETAVLQFRALGPDGYKTYGHYADIVSLDVLKGMITDDDEAPGVSQEFYDRIQDHYLEPMDVKKIDIGGGLIHGEASDFAKDKSGKMILSHTALALRPDQREIGSGAPFGTRDVLIPSHQDNTRRYAFDYLEDYFPTVPKHALRTLMNTTVVTFNPETILLKEGEDIDNIYLLLTGSVELLKTSNDMHSLVSAGSLVGEINALHHLPSMETYRALTFVQALQIPTKLYREVVDKYKLFADILRLMEGREFLQSTWIFGEAISYSTQNRIADEMVCHHLDKGEKYTPEKGSGVHIIREGEATLYSNGDELETIGRGDFFGEDSAIFGQDSNYHIVTNSALEFCTIKADVLKDIPIVQWKLIESLERRRHLLA
ncbi:cyclic nucleotide-binding domain-containing protein [Terasakiella sp. A23]|uniref:cyclic nucleotide-binding domain-containing protein n=1 Tax=Terasakiella sp. FCG-A23 TaxID=3080561 RepID=UPI002954F7DE|nr:cyclic nucleotide-binding domain-containing protein [Terasakiella sp. A23]MDV7340918.1 cyclic nucleotide-binding domain-containing protein [Terasakiella sp. A23]